MRVAYILAGLLVLPLLASLQATSFGADSAATGIDLFIEACQWQGLNPAMIHTGYAEFEVTVDKPPASEADIQKEIDERAAPLRKLIESQSDEKVKRNLRQAEAQLPRIIRARTSGARRHRIKVLFHGNDSTFGERRCETINQDPVTMEWERPLVALRRGLTKAGDDNVLWDSASRMAVVSSQPLGVEEFQAFGRIQGMPARLATAALLGGTSSEKVEFPADGVNAFKDQIAKLTSGATVVPLQLVGETKYDMNALASIVESRIKTDSGFEVSQRYWIDASRAYVCPLVQMHGEDGELLEEWSSSGYFLHERSGLWFPDEHVHTRYVPGTLTMEERATYRLDRATLRINQPVAEEEFAVQVPAGANVLDARDGKQINYKASAPVTLSLAKGGLDLESMEGLGVASVAPPASVVPRSSAGAGVGLIALLLLALAFFAWRPLKKRRGRAGAICALFCLLSPFGQGVFQLRQVKAEVPDPVVIEPKTIDFGRVNEANGPLELRFSLANRGDHGIEIKGIRPGCGCTVAKLKASYLPARERLEVPLAVNIHGRFGKFASEVLIDVSRKAEPLRPLDAGGLDAAQRHARRLRFRPLWQSASGRLQFLVLRWLGARGQV